MQHSLFHDWKHHLKLFGICGAVKQGEEEGDLLTLLIMTVFVEQPMTSPGSAKYTILIVLCKTDSHMNLVLNNITNKVPLHRAHRFAKPWMLKGESCILQ